MLAIFIIIIIVIIIIFLLILGQTACSLWDKTSPQPAFVNIILLEHGHVHSFSYCPWLLSLMTTAEFSSHRRPFPAMPKILPSAPLLKKFVYPDLEYSVSVGKQPMVQPSVVHGPVWSMNCSWPMTQEVQKARVQCLEMFIKFWCAVNIQVHDFGLYKSVGLGQMEKKKKERNLWSLPLEKKSGLL